MTVACTTAQADTRRERVPVELTGRATFRDSVSMMLHLAFKSIGEHTKMVHERVLQRDRTLAEGHPYLVLAQYVNERLGAVERIGNPERDPFRVLIKAEHNLIELRNLFPDG